MKNCFKCGLYSQGLSHDLSKYSPEEFLSASAISRVTVPPICTRRRTSAFPTAGCITKGRNRHHWEYWYDMINGKWQPIEMPFPYLVEMVCDRVAACQVYQKENTRRRARWNII